MIKKRKDQPEPYVLHLLSTEVPPSAILYVSPSFRAHVEQHWGMQTMFYPPEPRGCLLDTMFPDSVVLEDLPAGQVVFIWYDGDREMRKGLHYLSVDDS